MGSHQVIKESTPYSVDLGCLERLYWERRIKEEMSTATKANQYWWWPFSPIALAIDSLVGTLQSPTEMPLNLTVNATEGTSYWIKPGKIARLEDRRKMLSHISLRFVLTVCTAEVEITWHLSIGTCLYELQILGHSWVLSEKEDSITPAAQIISIRSHDS